MLQWLKSKLGVDAEHTQVVSNQNVPSKLLSIDPATKAAIGRITRRDHCNCLSTMTKKGRPQVPTLHSEVNVEIPAWVKTVDLIARISESMETCFEPSSHIEWEEWMQMMTLPREIGLLDKVKKVHLYGSHLRRLPPEVGRMGALVELDVYTSYSLHWLPYEVMRCGNLKDSRMSTRALYGNKNTKLPFPRLSKTLPALRPSTCSVCDRSFDGRTPQLRWTTQRVGTDHVPLLVHSCSIDCVKSIKNSPKGFFERPHRGGGGVGMPIENLEY